MNVIDLPFNRHVELRSINRDGNEVLFFDASDYHLNHVGTIHAAALYSLAEAASGHELLRAACVNPDNTVALLRSSTVKYRKPAHGRVIALSLLDPEVLDKFKSRIESKGRASIDVAVRLVDNESVEVLTGEFNWFLSRTEETNGN